MFIAALSGFSTSSAVKRDAFDIKPLTIGQKNHNKSNHYCPVKLKRNLDTKTPSR
jgi:hypothetical protein